MQPPRRPRNRAAQRRSISRARSLRAAPPDSERLLWDALRDRRLGGFKFRRQHPVGPFFVDFFCDEFLLAVEVDGTSHIGREEADLRRQRWLEAHRIQVIRFSHTDILQNLRGVLERILRSCRGPER